MPRLTVKHHKIYGAAFNNWNSEVLDKWVYDDFVADPRYKKEWISLTSLAYYPPQDCLFVGIGSFSAELLWRFDRKTGSFTSCGFEKVADSYDAKFHRSLELDGEDLYAGIALFHDVDKQFEARGGRLVRYNIPTGGFTFLGTPYPPAYIQSITMDRQRRILYGFGAMPEVFWRLDLDTGQSRLIAHIGSAAEFAQSHNPVLDGKGNLWGTYGLLRAFSYRTGPDSVRIFRYSPDTDEITFMKHGFPRTGEEGDKGKPDTLILGPDGQIYTGTDGGILARLNPETGAVQALCRPAPDTRRMAGLAFHPQNGLLYGTCGENYNTRLFAYDTAAQKLLWVHDIVDTETGIRPDRIHYIAFAADGILYAGENDNNDRSSYLWELAEG